MSPVSEGMSPAMVCACNLMSRGCTVLVRVLYTGAMSTIQMPAPNPNRSLAERGRRLRRLLKAQRYSNREAARVLGLSHTYVGARLNGDVDLSFSDIEAFARILNMGSVELFEHLRLPHLDSNQEPIGSKSRAIRNLQDHRAAKEAAHNAVARVEGVSAKPSA